MKRRRIILWVVLAVPVTVGCIIVPVGVRALASSYKYCRDVSEWGALDCSIMLELGDYYDENGKYPDSLEELPLVFEDGATPDMLKQIQYKVDETSCKYSYSRHAGRLWNTDTQTRVEITFFNGKEKTYMATTPKE